MKIMKGDFVRRKSDGRVLMAQEVKPRKKVAKVGPKTWIDFVDVEPASQEDYDAQTNEIHRRMLDSQLERSNQNFYEEIEKIATRLERLADDIRKTTSRYAADESWIKSPYELAEEVQNDVLWTTANMQMPRLITHARRIETARALVTAHAEQHGEGDNV